MQPTHDETSPCYCLKCETPVEESAEACVRCSTPFVGSGAFDKLRGPRPSALFHELFHPAAGDRAA